MNGQQSFTEAVAMITARIDGRALDSNLQSFLDENFPPGGEAFDDLATLCRQGIDEGWLCDREHGGVRFGRIIKPGAETNGFSVDVVQMEDLAGPYHGHPNGEIDMIIPESSDAKVRRQRAGLDGLCSRLRTLSDRDRWQGHYSLSSSRG